jgi:trans-aconitate methyltransferase
MELISLLCVTTDDPVIDVGGGESTLVNHLLAGGFGDLTVLDVSGVALAETRKRLKKAPVTMVESDLLAWQPERRYGPWHDRAVFHFLVDPADRTAYLGVLRAATGPGSALVVGTFATNGPPSCSGRAVARYSPDALAAALGGGFEVVVSREEQHVTPGGATQLFTWVAGWVK